MKYTLRLYIISKTQNDLDSLMATLPDIVDDRVWDNECEAPSQTTSEDGNIYMMADINFHAGIDRDVVFEEVQNINSVFSGCEVGSKIELIRNSHDEDGKSCAREAFYEVVA